MYKRKENEGVKCILCTPDVQEIMKEVKRCFFHYGISERI